jgi:hypothetical protein
LHIPAKGEVIQANVVWVEDGECGVSSKNQIRHRGSSKGRVAFCLATLADGKDDRRPGFTPLPCGVVVAPGNANDGARPALLRIN